jgi:integrase
MVELKHLKTNPCADVPRPKNKRGEDPAPKKFYANYDAIFSMLECCIGKSNHDTRRQQGLAIILVVWGGIRLEETVRLCWRDFTKNKAGQWVVTIKEADSKTFRRVNALPAATSTWVDQIVALLKNNYELNPAFPIISERSDPSKAIGEKEIMQRQKRFRHSWKDWAAANEDRRYEDPKTVKQNGLRHACGCYGFHKLGQDKLMLLMGEQDAKVMETHYRKYAPPEEADALYNTESPLVREEKAAQAKAEEEAGEKEIKNLMRQDDRISREIAIKLRKGEAHMEMRLEADGTLTYTQDGDGEL